MSLEIPMVINSESAGANDNGRNNYVEKYCPGSRIWSGT